jgi:hypothetical protein
MILIVKGGQMKSVARIAFATAVILPEGLLLSAASAQPTTVTYSTPGSHTFVVPAGVVSISVDAQGAEGGSGTPFPPEATPNPGGLGGRAAGVIVVSPGEALQINVGGKGGDGSPGTGGAGGVNGGAAGGPAPPPAEAVEVARPTSVAAGHPLPTASS